MYFHFNWGQCLFTQRTEFTVRISGHRGRHPWVRNVSDSPHITANRKPLTPSLHSVCSVPVRLKDTQWLSKTKQKKKATGKKFTIFCIRGISCFTAFSFLEEHMYLHPQKEAQNRCHWSRIYSADSELIPG